MVSPLTDDSRKLNYIIRSSDRTQKWLHLKVRSLVSRGSVTSWECTSLFRAITFWEQMKNLCLIRRRVVRRRWSGNCVCEQGIKPAQTQPLTLYRCHYSRHAPQEHFHCLITRSTANALEIFAISVVRKSSEAKTKMYREKFARFLRSFFEKTLAQKSAALFFSTNEPIPQIAHFFRVSTALIT